MLIQKSYLDVFSWSARIVGYKMDESGKVTAKWILDSSILSSIKPKIDIGLFVDFSVFTSFCMMWSQNCSADENKTILWSGHAKTGKNR